MGLSSYLKVGRAWQKLWQQKAISPEYQQWRHRFILKRLRLITSIAIVVWLTNILVETTIMVPLLDRSHPKHDFIHQNYGFLWATAIAQFAQFLAAWFLLKIPFWRKYPLLIFLWLISALFISRQISFTVFHQQIILAEDFWMKIFPLVAILMPVKWIWYLLAQGIVLGYFGVAYSAYGLRDVFVEHGIEYFMGIYNTVVVFSIVDLGVFLYEKSLQQEFELKRQLRLFLHTVSHDLRSPVLGTMFLLKSLINPAAKKTLIENDILEQVIDSSDRQLQLIDSLLEAHNTENKGIILRPRPAYINSLVQSVITDMQPFLDRNRAVVTKKIPAKLPLVNIDPLQIRRVYENIIANALEYNQSGLHLTLRVEPNNLKSDAARCRVPPIVATASRNNRHIISDSERWIYCTVSDDGEGIPPHLHSQLFDLYTRKASNKQSLGAGLGLYICRQIINAHGGEIGINSDNQGASFWFTLPVAEEVNSL